MAREIDESFPIRPTAIRGQLQFWWRATVGARLDDMAKLRRAHSEVWGSTEHPSPIIVDVSYEGQVSSPVACAEFTFDTDRHQFRSVPRWNRPFNRTQLPYALFPFQGKLVQQRTKIEVPPAKYLFPAQFKLSVSYPEGINFGQQIEPALWAWVNFGGVGSRTRRGCGAITCEEFKPSTWDGLITRFREYAVNGLAKAWPTFAEALLLGPVCDSAVEAWNRVIGLLNDFRQKVGIGRNAGSGKPGRSRWPEPESLRKATGKRHSKHQRLMHIPDNAFPRAEFGLPIVFHFKDPGDPPDTVLCPSKDPDGKDRDRMASPLILKPIALANKKFVPVVLQLKTLPLEGVELRSAQGSLPVSGQPVIRDRALAGYQDSPMRNRTDEGSALEAFLTFCVEQGFVKVWP